jgi:hypothetical protein
LHLGFYLASWGMMRGSSALLERSVRQLIPVVHAISQEPEESWALDVPDWDAGIDAVLALSDRIRRSFATRASDVLITKVTLGVFGCVPAFDRCFNDGFGTSGLSWGALVRIGDY